MVHSVPINGGDKSVVERLARPNILKLQPYRCARDDYSTGILLDANENSIGPTALPTNSDNHLILERYPCPYQVPLKEAFAAYRGHGIGPDNIFVGVGSDEAIDLLMRIFCVPSVDEILVTPPTYGMYMVSAHVNDLSILEVPLTPDFDLQIPQMLEAVTDRTKLLFVCSPGNPTCKAIPISDIEVLMESSQFQGIVVVDEAYVDFSSQTSAISLVHKYPNIVVLQTLSKAFGLAGIRCGFAVAHRDIIQLMNNVKAPYNINKMTSEVAINAFANIAELQKNIHVLLNQRELLTQELLKLDFIVKVFPSDSNFLLCRLKAHAYAVYKTMADRGIVVRYRGHELHCGECLRITVGTPEENKALLEALPRIYREIDAEH